MKRDSEQQLAVMASIVQTKHKVHNKRTASYFEVLLRLKGVRVDAVV